MGGGGGGGGGGEGEGEREQERRDGRRCDERRSNRVDCGSDELGIYIPVRLVSEDGMKEDECERSVGKDC